MALGAFAGSESHAMTAAAPKTNVYAVLTDEAEEPLKDDTRLSGTKAGRDGEPPSSARGSAQKHFGFDRRSGTGRGREVAKKGAGGKYTFGSVEDEVRDSLRGVKLEDAAQGVESGEGAADSASNLAGENKDTEAGLLSLEEYQQKLEKERAELMNKLVASKGPRLPGEESPDDAFRHAKRLDKTSTESDRDLGDALLASVAVKERKGRAATRTNSKSKRDSAKENLAAEFFTAPPPSARSRGPTDAPDDTGYHRARRSAVAGDAGVIRGHGGGGRQSRGHGSRRPARANAPATASGDAAGPAFGSHPQESNRDAATRPYRGRGGANAGYGVGSGRGRGRGRGARPTSSTRPRVSINTTDDIAFPSLGLPPDAAS